MLARDQIRRRGGRRGVKEEEKLLQEVPRLRRWWMSTLQAGMPVFSAGKGK